MAVAEAHLMFKNRLKYRAHELETPIYSALSKYAKEKNISFHTPGHKSGKLFKKAPGAYSDLMMLYETDLSISCPEIDSLYQPKGSIKKGLELAAKTFGAEKTHFVLGGTSTSNLIAMFSAFSPKDKIIISRNLHKSSWAGITLNQLQPIFTKTEEKAGIPLNVSVESIEAALKENPDSKGVLVTSPSYEGVSADLKGIAKLAHEYQIPLIVDEAWGPHFHFSEKFPQSAMQAKADMATQSTHKILGSFSQTSMLHTRPKLVNKKKVAETYNCFTSTSPFYPFLASLDCIRAIMQTSGKRLVEESYNVSQEIRRELSTLRNFTVSGKELIEGTEFGLDSNKILVRTKDGFKAAKKLRDEKIIVEKCSENSVLFLITIADTRAEGEALCDAMQKIDRGCS